jgi:hypothetical protein
MSVAIIFGIIFENILIFSMIAITIWIYQFTGYITIVILKFVINIIIKILQKISTYYYENTLQCNTKLINFIYVLIGFSIFKAYEFYVDYYKTKYYYW